MTLGTIHGNGPDGVLSKVLGHLKDELGLPTDDGEGIEDLLEAFIELTSTTAPITETTWPFRPSTVGVPENWRSTKNRFSWHMFNVQREYIQFIYIIQKYHQHS